MMVHALLPGWSTIQLATNHSEASRSKVPPGSSGLNLQYVAPASRSTGDHPSTTSGIAIHVHGIRCCQNSRSPSFVGRLACTQHILTGLLPMRVAPMSAAKKMYWAAWMARFVGHLYQDLRKRTLKTCTCVSHMMQGSEHDVHGAQSLKAFGDPPS